MKKLRKRNVTLIEMMIVMFLIALISGVVAYNYRGTLDQGKAFKTKTNMQSIENILNLRLATDPDSYDDIQSNWRAYVKDSPLVKDATSLYKDGWGADYRIDMEDGEIKVTSPNLESYERKHKGSSFSSK